jgi:hypothetical protein
MSEANKSPLYKAEVSPRMKFRHCEQKTQENGKIKDKPLRLLRGNPS